MRAQCSESDFNVMRGMAVKNMTEGVRDGKHAARCHGRLFMGVGMGMNAANQTLSGPRRDADTGRQQGQMQECSRAAAPAGQMPAAGQNAAGHDTRAR